PPQVCGEVKLIDVPEMNYTLQDKPYSRSEVCVRGNSIFKEYYKDPEKTKELIDKDGWCHTGDIIDRVKNIFKLAQDEYIAPEKVENVYCKHELIYQYGESLQASLVAIIVPGCDVLLLWAKQNNLGSYSFEELCEFPQVKNHILQTIVKYGKANDLKGFENVKNIHLTSEPFSLQNNLLTPTFKLKRHQAKI
ncbi:36487_t:CDS:2, partial [Racocetra persica]